jgi:hypothetical protein
VGFAATDFPDLVNAHTKSMYGDGDLEIFASEMESTLGQQCLFRIPILANVKVEPLDSPPTAALRRAEAPGWAMVYHLGVHIH